MTASKKLLSQLLSTPWFWSYHLYGASLWYIIMSSQFSVNKVEVGVKDLMSYSLTASEKKKKAYLCSAVDLSVSVRTISEDLLFSPSFLCPLHSSLHHGLPSSYAYLLTMLQGFCLTGIPYGGAGWQQVKLHTDGLYHWLFSSKHKCWVILLWALVLGLLSVFS